MSQSLSRVLTHMVFSTKHRKPLIDDAIEQELFAYLGGVCKGMDCLPLKIGGYRDHVHILSALSKKKAIMDVMEEIKKCSSKWIKTVSGRYADFYWQDGYSIFSVEEERLSQVIAYIENQREHHKKESFQAECRKLFDRHGIVYDERYVWD